MNTVILKENVLTDNVLLLPEYGKVFKGGYIAIVREYVYQNAWSDKLKNEQKFKSEKSLLNFLAKNYPKFEYIA
jgi:hypothetical protein